MSRDLFVLPPNRRPTWVDYPRSFLRLADQGLTNLAPWQIMKAERVFVYFPGLAGRYPTRQLFPFAYRQDTDEVACWSNGTGERVFVIHDFTTAGWESGQEFADVWAWFRWAVDDTIFWED